MNENNIKIMLILREMISHIAGIFNKWRDGSKMER